MSEHEQVTAATDEWIGILKDLIARGIHPSDETDQSLLARIDADAKVIAELRLERDAAHAGGEELQAALVLANQTIAELKGKLAGYESADRDQHVLDIDDMLDGIHKDREEED
jgi:hypothetical protein